MIFKIFELTVVVINDFQALLDGCEPTSSVGDVKREETAGGEGQTSACDQMQIDHVVCCSKKMLCPLYSVVSQ